ncbi:hypothetical protein [Streptomyces sp. SID12488]|uniref:hypothetical protein n=1 Tax=Streptomyces sp. SID12488 TaxID=2706040 RepID=UPI0031BA4F33
MILPLLVLDITGRVEADADAVPTLDEAGISRTPGWSPDVLRYLFGVADVTAIGHEQTDTDPGLAGSRGGATTALSCTSFSGTAGRSNSWPNLDRVPEAGALIVAIWPKPYGGSAFPARVFALHPAP